MTGRGLSASSGGLGADGIAAEGVTDGARGLELALTGIYQLVILDLLMPGMDGTSVLAQTMARRRQQAVVVLSALTDVETNVRCFGTGAADYIGKPFALAELLARVRARLASSGSFANESVISAGGLRLDVRRRIADAGEGPVSVSGREFLLLQHLMSRAGEVCTHLGLLVRPRDQRVDVYVDRARP